MTDLKQLYLIRDTLKGRKEYLIDMLNINSSHLICGERVLQEDFERVCNELSVCNSAIEAQEKIKNLDDYIINKIHSCARDYRVYLKKQEEYHFGTDLYNFYDGEKKCTESNMAAYEDISRQLRKEGLIEVNRSQKLNDIIDEVTDQTKIRFGTRKFGENINSIDFGGFEEHFTIEKKKDDGKPLGKIEEVQPTETPDNPAVSVFYDIGTDTLTKLLRDGQEIVKKNCSKTSKLEKIEAKYNELFSEDERAAGLDTWFYKKYFKIKEEE